MNHGDLAGPYSGGALAFTAPHVSDLSPLAAWKSASFGGLQAVETHMGNEETMWIFTKKLGIFYV